MELFKTDRRLVSRVGAVPGMESSEVEELFRRRPPLDGMPVLLDDQMRPVEPVSSWFRSLALAERDEATMRAYAYAVLRLMEFLRNRGSDLLTATETDLLEFRHWRTQAQDDPIQRVTWEKEAAAINGLYGWLVDRGQLQRRPWRLSGRRDTLRNGVSRDVKVRHLTLEQYLYFRDVGLGGQTSQAALDVSFRGWSPHRNRAGAELALLTGMRLQEWSTVLLPELGIDITRPGEPVEFRLAACAKFGRPRMVHIPADALSMISTYLMLERREIVDKAQKTLKGRRDELFVVDRIAQERGRLHGVLDGRRVARSIAEMPPGLRGNTVLDTGEGLEPLAVFLGRGGRMLLSSSWDKIRWGAWTRMRDHAAHCDAPMLPGTRWLFHDLRHTFALRLLIYLTREAMADGASGELPMSTLLDHMTYNPLLIVQRRLGHASPTSTYRYVKYLKDPMREVDEAFRGWTAAGGASYAEIARTLLSLDGDDGATQG